MDLVEDFCTVQAGALDKNRFIMVTRPLIIEEEWNIISYDNHPGFRGAAAGPQKVAGERSQKETAQENCHTASLIRA